MVWIPRAVLAKESHDHDSDLVPVAAKAGYVTNPIMCQEPVLLKSDVK